MMQKRTLYSLLLISFIVVFGFSFASANDITIQSKNVSRCTNSQVNVTANVTEADGVSAIEAVLVIANTGGCAALTGLSVTWDPAFTQLPDRVVDLSHADGVSPDTVRIAALRLNPGGNILATGSKLIAQLKFTTNDCCAGTMGINGGTLACPNVTASIETQFVNASTLAVVPAAVVAGTVTLVNATPVLAAIPNATLPWGGIYTGTAHAADPDTVGAGCEVITYSKLAGPAAMTVNPATGAIFWATTSADVCTHTVSIVATDKCNAADTISFTICVTNVAPVATCPANMNGCLGSTVTAQVTGVDPDGGPGGLLYSLVSTTAPGGVSVNPLTGLVTFNIGYTADYTGTFQICVAVADGAPACAPCSPSNADTCCFNVTVKSAGITIQKQHGPAGKGVFVGQPTTVDITMLPSNFQNFAIGGYDLLVQYDNSVLTFMGAAAGEFLTDCGWEYFTYRQGPFGNCGSGCPSGMLRLVAIAEINNGANHPLCFVNTGSISNQLAQLTFLVANDRNLECLFVPIRFFWIDCGDNSLSNVKGDTLLISNHVFDWVGPGDVYTEITDLSAGFPTAFGAPSPECDVYTAKGTPVRCAQFYNGGIDIICADSIDSRGDINLNGVSYEIADAVMFTNYFIYGISAFQGHFEGSQAASDVNGDGLMLTVADLVNLIRVVIGDQSPLPKVGADYAVKVATDEAGIMTVKGDVAMGAAYVVVKGYVNPALGKDASGMNIASNYDSETGNTRILVSPAIVEGTVVTGFTGEFLKLGDGEAQVVSVEMSTAGGQMVIVNNAIVPKNFELAQNYPNPFNPTTTIRFDIPKAASWTLTVYNVAGQVVSTYAGEAASAGRYSVEFDGAKLASGLYLYKLDAGEFTSVKKMVMIK
jgi:hypothetical protein